MSFRFGRIKNTTDLYVVKGSNTIYTLNSCIAISNFATFAQIRYEGLCGLCVNLILPGLNV